MASDCTSADIDRAAAEWTARLDAGRPLTDAEEQAFAQWLDGDPRCRGALLRMQALFLRSEAAAALGGGFRSEVLRAADSAPADQGRGDARAAAAAGVPVRRGLSRRQALNWARGAAVAAAAATAIGVSLPASGAVIRTAKGEMRRVPLADGSSVLLNTESAMQVAYEEGQRRVALLDGEAFFTVAADRVRPFVVEAGGRRLRAASARFSLRKLQGQPLHLLVQQGAVRLPGVGHEAGGVTVGPNMRLTLPDRSGADAGTAYSPVAVEPGTLGRELAWQDGKLAFEGETLREAAEAFARYSDRRILIHDDRLAAETVTGLYAANDPVGFGRTVAQVFDAGLSVERDAVILRLGSGVVKKNLPAG
jgi:transmembrane sensor